MTINKKQTIFVSMEISRNDITFLIDVSNSNSLVGLNQIPINLKNEFDLYFFGKTLVSKNNNTFAYPHDIKNWIDSLFAKYKA